MNKFIIFFICFLSITSTCYADLLNEANSVSIFIQASGVTDCKEANMRLYWFFRTAGYKPLIQYGKKKTPLGFKGHVWIELDGKVYDATDPAFNGTEANNSFYIVDKNLK